MADQTQKPFSKIWSDEKTYFVAFWVGVATCALVQAVFTAIAFQFASDLIASDEPHFILKCLRNTCTAMPIAGVVAALLAALMRRGWSLRWMCAIPTVCVFFLFFFGVRFRSNDPLSTAHSLFLIFFFATLPMFSYLRVKCDEGHDAGLLYVLLMLIAGEIILIVHFMELHTELRRMLNAAAFFSLVVFDGILLLCIRKLQRRGWIATTPPRFHFSLRALMILVLTASAWMSLIVTLHRKPHEKPVPIQRA